MFDRIKQSFDLLRASVRILRQDSHLLFFPAISVVAMILVLLAFALPMLGGHSLDGIGKGGLYSIAFLFYVVQYFVIFYFNVALVGAVMRRLDGGTPTLGDGLHIANSRISAILGYAVIAATVGVILRAIQERVGFVGKLIVGLLGASWTMATFMVVPVVVARDVGAVEAIAESGSLLKRTWGENLAGQTGLGGAFFVIYLGLAAVAALLAVVLTKIAGADHPGMYMMLGAVVVLAFAACLLAQATLSGIYSAVLYRYAVDGFDAPGFDENLLGEAFQQKS